MRNLYLYKISLIISLSIIIVGIIFKILHFPYAEAILLIGQILGLLYTIIGLVCIYKSADISIYEKIFWTIGFIIFSLGFGLYYYFKEIKPKIQNNL